MAPDHPDPEHRPHDPTIATASASTPGATAASGGAGRSTAPPRTGRRVVPLDRPRSLRWLEAIETLTRTGLFASIAIFLLALVGALAVGGLGWSVDREWGLDPVLRMSIGAVLVTAFAAGAVHVVVAPLVQLRLIDLVAGVDAHEPGVVAPAPDRARASAPHLGLALRWFSIVLLGLAALALAICGIVLSTDPGTDLVIAMAVLLVVGALAAGGVLLARRLVARAGGSLARLAPRVDGPDVALAVERERAVADALPPRPLRGQRARLVAERVLGRISHGGWIVAVVGGFAAFGSVWLTQACATCEPRDLTDGAETLVDALAVAAGVLVAVGLVVMLVAGTTRLALRAVYLAIIDRAARRGDGTRPDEATVAEAMRAGSPLESIARVLAVVAQVLVVYVLAISWADLDHGLLRETEPFARPAAVVALVLAVAAVPLAVLGAVRADARRGRARDAWWAGDADAPEPADEDDGRKREGTWHRRPER